NVGHQAAAAIQAASRQAKSRSPASQPICNLPPLIGFADSQPLSGARRQFLGGQRRRAGRSGSNSRLHRYLIIVVLRLGDTVAIGNADAASLASIQILLERQLGPGVPTASTGAPCSTEKAAPISTQMTAVSARLTVSRQQAQLTRIRLLILAAAFRRPRLRPFCGWRRRSHRQRQQRRCCRSRRRSELRLLAAAARWLFPSTSLAAKEDAEFKEVVENFRWRLLRSTEWPSIVASVRRRDDDSGADIDDSSDI
uniref:Ubiquitin-like domain-containing protein n=1 Tax=Macrostomum lignano TaxID=282301 RepID=A0A1I8F5I9_9PLAT